MANKILPVAEALKQVYTALGGNDDEVLDMSTNTELIQEIAGVATGGGGLPEVSDADEGKVLTVDSSGEWAAETPSGVPTVIVYQIDSNGNYEISGNFAQCLNLLSTGKPVLAYWYNRFFAFPTTYFEYFDGLTPEYDGNHPDQIKLRHASTDYFIWTADSIEYYD